MSLMLTLITLLALSGCAARGPATVGTPVTLTDVAEVAGRWAGLSDMPGHRNEDQYLEVTVHRDGTYQASAARMIGLMDAQGRVELSDGRLQVWGERGTRGTATLFALKGERTLQVEMTDGHGGRVTARLRPKP